MPRVTAEQKQAKRDSILLAAVVCFARDGFHKTTMSDIAQMAGVSDGLAYRYFSGKDEIIREAVRIGTESTDPNAAEVADGDPASLIRLLYESSFRRFDLPEREAVVGLRLRSFAEALTSREAREHVVARWRQYAEIERSLWARAQEQGALSADLDPGAVVCVLSALHDGLDLRWSLDPDFDAGQCRKVVMAMLTGRFWRAPEDT